MSLRRFLTLFALQNKFYLNTSLTLRCNPVPFTFQRQRFLHIGSVNGLFFENQYIRKPKKPISQNRGCDIVNQVIPLHDIGDPKTVTPDDWRSNPESFKNSEVFRSILEELHRRKLYDAGKSYIEMIKKYNPHMLSPFNEIYILRFLNHIAPNFTTCTDEQEIEYIQNTFLKIRKAFQVLEPFSAQTLILAMLRTPKWKMALELFDDMSLLSKPDALVCSTIIHNALKEGEVELAWSIIAKVTDSYLCPHDVCWVDWLQHCRQSGVIEWKDGVGRMLEYFYANHIHMSIAVAKELKQFIDELCPEYSVEECDIQRSYCSTCSTKLHSEFSTADHADLKEMVEKIINHDTVFASTTPQEMEKFKTFIENCAPYNVVLDGLNVLHRKTSLFFKTVIRLKSSLNAKFLLLGRLHLFHANLFREVANYCQVFLCENLSRDDVYVLYAAIYHRPDVKFVSHDKMRSQFYYLSDDNRRNLFLRWQFMNQIDQHSHTTSPTYLPEVHKSEDGAYHIPCVTESSGSMLWKPANADYWLCIRRGPRKKAPKLFFKNTQNSVKPEMTSRIDDEVVNDIVRRVDFGSGSDSDLPDNNGINPVHSRRMMVGHQVVSALRRCNNKYRRKDNFKSKEQSPPWLLDSLRNDAEDENVLHNVKKRFKQMRDPAKNESSSWRNSPTTDKKS